MAMHVHHDASWGRDGSKAKRSMTESPWVVYLVECSDESLYAGITTDVEARVAKHNQGSGAKYTRTRRPVALVYAEQAVDRGAALKREHEIKRMSAAEKRRLIQEVAK